MAFRKGIELKFDVSLSYVFGPNCKLVEIIMKKVAKNKTFENEKSQELSFHINTNVSHENVHSCVEYLYI